mmetsp:Transcript_29520/g.61794  ORF Transcript_29520/g.61794 Transcript_29520/m.61794 type:complete len:81 (+) Transcript_29520:520-762(+)
MPALSRRALRQQQTAMRLLCSATLSQKASLSWIGKEKIQRESNEKLLKRTMRPHLPWLAIPLMPGEATTSQQCVKLFALT